MRLYRMMWVCLCAGILSVGLLAQDETPTALPTDTDIPTELPTSTELPSATPLPSETATLIPTDTDTPTLTATMEMVTDPAPTEENVATAVSTDIMEMSATASETLALSPTMSATATLTQPPTAIPFPAEPALTVLVTDDFELGELLLWQAGPNWSFVGVESGTALQSSAGIDPLIFTQNNMLDVSATIRVQLHGGAVRLNLR